MAVIIQDFGSVGSNVKTGDTIKINGSETTETNAALQIFTIETGLNEVHHFTLMAKVKTSGYTTYRQVVTYDGVLSPNKYDSAVIYPTAGYGACAVTIGTEANGRSISIWSISGGTITLRTGSTGVEYSSCNDFYWFAD